MLIFLYFLIFVNFISFYLILYRFNMVNCFTAIIQVNPH